VLAGPGAASTVRGCGAVRNRCSGRQRDHRQSARIQLGAVRLYGRVIDFPTNAPVRGASVTLTGSPTSRTLTDASGSYETAALPGSYPVSVNGENAGGIGFKSAYHADFFMRVGACTGFYGTVFDARSGEPIPGVTVYFGGGGWSARDTTTSQGAYVLRLECPARCSGSAGDALTKGCTGSTGFTIAGSGYRDFFSLWSRAEWGLAGFRRVDWTLQPQ